MEHSRACAASTTCRPRLDADKNEDLDAVNIMTLHSAKGLEFETVFLPGWEEGYSRTTLAGRRRPFRAGGRTTPRLCRLTRAKRRAHIWFVSNRRIHGLWQSTIPSRFLEEHPLSMWKSPKARAPTTACYGRNPYGQSRFDKQEPFQNTYSTPGWKRAQANRTDATRDNWGSRSGHQVERIGYGESGPRGKTIQGETVAKSRSTCRRNSLWRPRLPPQVRQRQCLGRGRQQLTVDFDRAGRSGAGRVCGAGVSSPQPRRSPERLVQHAPAPLQGRLTRFKALCALPIQPHDPLRPAGLAA